MTVGSLFAGIGGFDLGFERAGFQIAWRCEIEPFPRRILCAKMPGPSVFGDVRGIGKATVPTVDVLVGGFPCQDLSVAGKRVGLGGERSGLFFQFVRLIRELRPRWWVIENVPGFLTASAGLDFATALRELDDSGQVGSWRVLDSQYFGLAQRRERVFLVGGPRGLVNRALEVLFEPSRRDGDSQAGSEARAGVAATLRGRSARAGVNEPGRGGEDDANLVFAVHGEHSCAMQGNGDAAVARRVDVVRCLDTTGGYSTNQGGTVIANALKQSRGGPDDNSAQANHLIAVGERARALVGSMFKRHDDDTDTLIPTLSLPLKSGGNSRHAEDHETYIAAPITASAGHHGHSSPRGDGSDNLVASPLTASYAKQIDSSDRNAGPPNLINGVRRLTPLECERLQGFPGGWTCLCGEGHRGSQFCSCKDTPRYKALGNAVSVPVAEWIARRISIVEGLTPPSGEDRSG